MPSADCVAPNLSSHVACKLLLLWLRQCTPLVCSICVYVIGFDAGILPLRAIHLFTLLRQDNPERFCNRCTPLSGISIRFMRHWRTGGTNVPISSASAAQHLTPSEQTSGHITGARATSQHEQDEDYSGGEDCSLANESNGRKSAPLTWTPSTGLTVVQFANQTSSLLPPSLCTAMQHLPAFFYSSHRPQRAPSF